MPLPALIVMATWPVWAFLLAWLLGRIISYRQDEFPHPRRKG